MFHRQLIAHVSRVPYILIPTIRINIFMIGFGVFNYHSGSFSHTFISWVPVRYSTQWQTLSQLIILLGLFLLLLTDYLSLLLVLTNANNFRFFLSLTYVPSLPVYRLNFEFLYYKIKLITLDKKTLLRWYQIKKPIFSLTLL